MGKVSERFEAYIKAIESNCTKALNGRIGCDGCEIRNTDKKFSYNASCFPLERLTRELSVFYNNNPSYYVNNFIMPYVMNLIEDSGNPKPSIVLNDLIMLKKVLHPDVNQTSIKENYTLPEEKAGIPMQTVCKVSSKKGMQKLLTRLNRENRYGQVEGISLEV